MTLRTAVLAVVAMLAISGTLASGQQQKNTTASPVVVTSETAKTEPAPASGEPVTQFQSKAQLVLVPVVVTRDNVPVTGLRKDQFKVFENGKEQKLAVFEEVKSDPAPINVTQTRDREQKTFSNMQVDPSSPKRLVIVVLDLINTRFEDRVYGRQQLIKFLSSSVDNGALVSLVALGRGRVQVIHDFTSNPDVLVAALQHVDKKSDGGVNLNADLTGLDAQAFQNEVNTLTDFLETGRFNGLRFESSGGGAYQWLRIRQTLDGLNLIAQAYAGVPGRKALIWATSGFPFQIDGSTMLLDSSRMQSADSADLSDILDYYEDTWRLMNNANFALYPVDLRGLVVNSITASERVNPRNMGRELQRRSAMHQDTIATFQTFAEMTGGRAFYNTNDLAGSFKKATADSASYYMLAYYLDRSQEKGKKKDWRKLHVKVDAPRVNVRTRSGFFANGDQPQNFENEIALALASPLEFTSLPVTVHWLEQSPAVSDSGSQQQSAPGRKKAAFEIAVPANMIAIDPSDNNLLSMEVVASARSGKGTEINGISQKIEGHLKKESLEKLRTSGFVFKSDIALPPGRYLVRIVVHDNVGQRTGSVAAPVVVN